MKPPGFLFGRCLNKVSKVTKLATLELDFPEADQVLDEAIERGDLSSIERQWLEEFYSNAEERLVKAP